jgi:hypothetical protein
MAKYYPRPLQGVYVIFFIGVAMMFAPLMILYLLTSIFGCNEIVQPMLDKLVNVDKKFRMWVGL